MLSELVADVQSDFTGDDGEPLVDRDYVQRAAERALPVAAADLGRDYRLEGEIVSPAMPGEHRELWLIRTKILTCRYLRAKAAQRVDFSSGDKSMSRSSEAKNFADLEKDLMEEYAARVKKLNPPTDEILLKLDASPLIYKAGSRRREKE